MIDILRSIANSSELFPHLKTPRFECEDDCPKPATHDLFRADEDNATYTAYLCDEHYTAELQRGLLDNYTDRGNPNK
jgi:hypothetical protein